MFFSFNCVYDKLGCFEEYFYRKLVLSFLKASAHKLFLKTDYIREREKWREREGEREIEINMIKKE